MEPPTKLERLLFRHMGYSLTRIHAHIVAYLGAQQPRTITELAQAIHWDGQTTRKGCRILADHKLVAIRKIKAQAYGSKRIEPSLTPAAREILAKAAGSLPKLT